MLSEQRLGELLAAIGERTPAPASGAVEASARPEVLDGGLVETQASTRATLPGCFDFAIS